MLHCGFFSSCEGSFSCLIGAPLLDGFAAGDARRQVPLDVGAIARIERPLDVFVDGGLVRMHIHRSRYVRRGAALPRRKARSFMRALNTCDFEVPSAMPSSLATSL